MFLKTTYEFLSATIMWIITWKYTTTSFVNVGFVEFYNYLR